jgi:superfamily II DNA/RNA helicase
MNADHPFALLGLAPELLNAVADLGFTTPTAVQSQAIPLALHDPDAHTQNDLMVSSQTGSGKTAAFLLPVLHTLLSQQQAKLAEEQRRWAEQVAAAEAAGEPLPKRARRKDPTNPRNFKPAVPGALVLCPTRELAQQVAHDAIDLVKHCKGLRIACVVGGLPYAVQIARLQNADLVVATPGRLLDLQRSNHLNLDQVQFLVVDEADRMLDLGFADDLAEIHRLTEQRHQTLMFSATFAPRIQQLAARIMRQPQRVQIDSPQEKHANIKQVMFWADHAFHKRQLLDHWLRDASIDQAIVFASTQIECDALAQELQQVGFSAVALHGALSQGLRNRRLMALREGRVQILVATDVAARGIDVPTITHVFNFGLPMKSEDYVHRIGRTGRAGREGQAVTFAEWRDRRKILDIEAYTQQAIRSEVIPGLEPKNKPEKFKKPYADSRKRGFGESRGAGRGAPRGQGHFSDSRPGDRNDRQDRHHERNDRFAEQRNDRFVDSREPARGGPRADDRFGGPRHEGAGARHNERSGKPAARGHGAPAAKAHKQGKSFAKEHGRSGPRIIG